MERIIFLKVLATVDHCDNSCRWISHDVTYCTLFQGDLTWDKRRKTNGAKRLTACKESEIQR